MQNKWHPNPQPCQCCCRSTSRNTPTHNQHNQEDGIKNVAAFDAATYQYQVVFRALVLASSLKFWQGAWHSTSCSFDRPGPLPGLKQVAKLQELSCVSIFNGSNLASIQRAGFATGNTVIQISCEVCSLP